MEKLFSTVLILVVIGVSAVGYVFYRYSNMPTASELEHPRQLQGFSPSICRTVINSFDGNVSTVIYVADGNIKIDKTFTQDGSIINVHNILTSERGGTSYGWLGDTEQNAIVSTNVFDSNAKHVNTDGIVCEPWWFVDESVFELPSNIKLDASG